MQEHTPSHVHQPYAPGKNFLLVTGILMIVFGVFGLIGSIILPFLGDILEEAAYILGDDFGLDEIELTVGLAVVAAISSIIMLVIGTLGILWRQIVEKAQILLIGAIVFIVFDIISNIFLGTIGVLSFINWILPILFIIGAVKNKAAMTA